MFGVSKETLVYTISAGKHHCDKRRLCLIHGDTLKFLFCFYSSCEYNLSSNVTDINKLYGFREGFFGRDSARFGWRSLGFGCGIMLYPYVHYDGVNFGSKDPAPICMVEVDKDYIGTISAFDGRYYFSVKEFGSDGITHEAEYPRRPNGKFKFLQYPYFGGNEKAPHKMHFEIRNLIA